MSGGRALGVGLLMGAAVVMLLMLLWLAVSGASGGGIVLGLLLLAVFAGPLAGAGWYVLARQPAEARAAAQLASVRHVIEADRLFRQEIGTTLRALADRADLPRARVLDLANGVEAGIHRGLGWEELVRLDASGLDQLRRYDDLVWERVRRLRDGTLPSEDVARALSDLQRTLDQREDLLVRGRGAPALDAAELLRSEPRASAPAAADLTQVGLGWAISRGAEDYVVEGVASYFADGRTWKLAHLVPTSSAAQPAWLYVGPAAVDLGLLDEVPPPPALGDALVAEGVDLPLVGGGTAVADIAGGSGSAQGVLVAYRRYQAGRRMQLVEQWPDARVHAYTGQLVGPGDIDVWPTSTPAAR